MEPAVKINLKHIAEGWSKSLGLFEVTEETKALSVARIKECALCPFAKESSFLKILGREAVEMGAIVCKKCKCPVNEKTLVTDETCPINNW